MEIDKLCPGCMQIIEGKERLNICPNCGYDFINNNVASYQLRPFSILNGKYLTGRVIGEGGFGITYLGMDLTLEIPVAIKEFYPSGFVTREADISPEMTIFAGDSAGDVVKWRDNFIREARNLAKFNGLTGIVKVQEIFYENNTAYIVMEYIDGITLRNYLDQNGGKLPVDVVFQLMEPVIQSLQQVHEAGVIHRDISPANIMITKRGSMKLLDFGAARDVSGLAEKSLSVMLKPGYAPEEQYRTRGRQGPWSDVYALCATIYKCLTGVTPIESTERQREDSLKMPSAMGVALSAEKEAALKKGLAVYAEDRIQNMNELYAALYAKRKERSIEQQGTRRHSWKLLKYTLAVVVAVAFGVVFALVSRLRENGTLGNDNSGTKRVQSASNLLENDYGIESSSDGIQQQGAVDGEETQNDMKDPLGNIDSAEMQRELNELDMRAREAEQQKDPLTMAEILDEYCKFASNYQNVDIIRERVQRYYDQYRDDLFAQHDFYYGLEVSVSLYVQMSSDLDTAITVTNSLNSLGIFVEGDAFAERRRKLTEDYRSAMAEAFDAQASSDITQNGVVSRSTLWKLMDGIPDTDLMDAENPEDPITRRYSAALALHIDSELDSMDNTQAILRIYDELENTDYNPILIYYLAYRYEDVGAAEWLNFIDQEIIYGFSTFSAADMKNYAVAFYTNPDYSYWRQLLRDYMRTNFLRP